MISYIEIDGWRTNIRFSSAHIIPEYDKCGRLHGHTYAIHAKIYGEIEENGIIVDFRFAKDILKKIADELDHKILIPVKSPLVRIKEKEVRLSNGEKDYVFPLEDCALLPLRSSSAENLASYVMDKFLESLKDYKNIVEIEIGIDEGFGQGARVKKRLK